MYARDGTPVGPSAAGGPVVVGLGPDPDPAAIELAFDAADRRTAGLHAVLTPATIHEPVGPDTWAPVRATLDQWSEKYPGVPVRVSVHAGVDRAVALAVASHDAQLVVLGGDDARGPAAVARALAHRVRCPVAVAPAADGRRVAGGTRCRPSSPRPLAAGPPGPGPRPATAALAR